jgi:hypothetical protein
MADGGDQTTRLPRWISILVLSLAGLLLEVGYTRVVSYKLWYYFTYLVIGLALLGIGSGGVVVAVARRLRGWTTDRILAVSSLVGAATIAAGYLVIAELPIDTRAIWDYGTRASFTNLGRLAVICFILFASFVALGVMLSVLLGRAGAEVGRLYFADLVGAGLGCLIAIPLIASLGPPAVIWLAALLFAAIGVASLPRRPLALAGGGVLLVVLAAGLVARGSLPDVRPEAAKVDGRDASFSEWGPVFRVDVIQVTDEDDGRLLAHDATFGSGIRRFDGDVASLTGYDTDTRATPFQILGRPPERELIIGSAGGNEILASLAFGAPNIEAVELNPVTVGLLTDEFADYTGNLTDRPEVHLTQGDGRSYLARSDDAYDLVWFVAPDSYAANNAASSGAFVLSESYLYTAEMIEETLEHLTDDGIMVVQFGELDLEGAPNRTSRYLTTARAALDSIGVDDPGDHLLVSAFLTDSSGDLSTIVVKRTPFTADELERFADGIPQLDGTVGIHGGSIQAPAGLADLAVLAGGTDAEVDAAIDAYPRSITPVRDDAPFFWHFSSFTDVLGDITEPIAVTDPEDSIGERVLLLLLAIGLVYAAVFLLLPFLAVRRDWEALPAKGPSIGYFAALGLGFMLFEITMIQRLTEFLGYPTYSLTVTLASILVFTGIGAMLSGRYAARPAFALRVVLGALVALALAYRFGLDPLTDGLLDQSLAVRVVVALLVLAPLGLCLGTFMPLGLAAVTGVPAVEGHEAVGERYVAWAWAINGFFSVIGSVLTTILSMTFGFATVQLLAVVIYAVAVATYGRLARALSPTPLRP